MPAQFYKITLIKYKKALKDTGGIKSKICKSLGIVRTTLDKYLAANPKAMTFYTEEKERIGDVAESVLFEAIKNKDLKAVKWYLGRMHKDRGYTIQTDVMDVTPKKESKLSDEDVNKLIKDLEADE